MSTSLRVREAERLVAHKPDVIFHIGANNIRSQKAIEKLGAVKTGEEEEAYYGEPPSLNFVYSIRKAGWPVP